ncbi:hypothetical protein [Sulfuriflexus sp.]|uniref:hypothetical protein n=1 Tax=Sulfuriflexus sp. TaxID=2015443 RepID=UPI0028CBCCF9|nr:hypothetical protein [Sulfuriflexus sp.]MDT8404072.1 hypothetical protein [Sulfuriflexus sp.]
MPAPILFSIIESPTHPPLSEYYRQLGIEEVRLTSTRKAIHALKTQTPDFVVAEFFYGYGNNYAGVNICNLDVFLYSLQKYAPAAKVIVFVDKEEKKGSSEKLVGKNIANLEQ